MKMLHTAFAVIVVGWVATGCTDAQGSETKPARPVKAQAIALAASPSGIRYSATIEALEQVPLAFKASGYVDDLLRRPGADGRSRAVQAGDLVTRGTVLARVRETEYRERVNQGRSRVAEAEAGLQKARLDLERARTLFAAESLTKPDLDAAQAAFDTSEARLAGARADVELAATALRDAALTAPTNGILLERRIEVGSLVGAGTVAFVLCDIGSVKARFGIPDRMIHSVTLGEPIDLVVEAFSGATFQGQVTAIAPAADAQSRVFDVEVTLANRTGQLRPGMIGTVSVRAAGVETRSAAPSLPTVPLTAIVRSKPDTGEYAAFIIERQGDVEVARMRQVQLGDVIGNGITVVKGLGAGERVVVTGANLLVDGERVRIVP
jgi:RND family efflux transporter MFP subunit